MVPTIVDLQSKSLIFVLVNILFTSRGSYLAKKKHVVLLLVVVLLWPESVSFCSWLFNVEFLKLATCYSI